MIGNRQILFLVQQNCSIRRDALGVSAFTDFAVSSNLLEFDHIVTLSIQQDPPGFLAWHFSELEDLALHLN